MAHTSLLHTWKTQHAEDFAAGVDLLARHGGDRHISRTLWQRIRYAAATGGYVDPYLRGKLAAALQKTDPQPAPQPAAAAPAPQPPIPQSPIPNPPTPAPAPAPPEAAPADPSPSLENPYNPDATPTSPQAKALHKRHAHVHALMVAAKTDDERAKYAREIMEEIIPALDAEYDRIRAEASKSGGDSQTPPDSDPIIPYPDPIPGPILNAADYNAFKKLQSVRTRISALKKKIKAEKDPAKKAKYEKELQEKTVERDRLENELA